MALIGTMAAISTIQAPVISEYEEAAAQNESTKPPKSTSEVKPTNPPAGIISALNLVSAKYRLNYDQMYITIQNESHFDSNAIGDDGDSLGIAQITTKTWFAYCAVNGKDERTDPYESIECMGKIWNMGYQHWWTEWCKAFGVGNPKCDYVFEWLNLQKTSQTK